MPIMSFVDDGSGKVLGSIVLVGCRRYLFVYVGGVWRLRRVGIGVYGCLEIPNQNDIPNLKQLEHW